MCRYRYKHVITFGGWKEDFMLVVNQSIMRGGNTVEQGTQRLLFVMSRGKVTCQIKRFTLFTDWQYRPALHTAVKRKNPTPLPVFAASNFARV